MQSSLGQGKLTRRCQSYYPSMNKLNLGMLTALPVAGSEVLAPDDVP